MYEGWRGFDAPANCREDGRGDQADLVDPRRMVVKGSTLTESCKNAVEQMWRSKMQIMLCYNGSVGMVLNHVGHCWRC